MKKYMMVFMVLFMVLFVGGCSQLDMVALTDMEENTIAVYSAYVVAKYNSHSKYGLKNYEPEEEEETEKPEKTDKQEQAEQPSETDDGEEQTAELTAKEDTSVGETQQYGTFTDAIGISNVTVEYVDYDVTDNISESTYFSMDATEGKTFLVVNLRVTNTAEGTVNVDIPGGEPKFRLAINDGRKELAQITLLLDDFSTLSKDFDPGESQTARLVFEIPEEEAAEISTMTVDAVFRGNSVIINLL